MVIYMNIEISLIIKEEEGMSFKLNEWSLEELERGKGEVDTI